MLDIFNSVIDSSHTTKWRQAANEILENSGHYLTQPDLERFIAAEISDAEAESAIIKRKAFIERAAQLLPSLLFFFGINDEENLRSTLLKIDDCCHDFPIILDSPHEKKEKRQIKENLDKAKIHANSLLNLLNDLRGHLDFEFDQHLKAILETRDMIRHSDIENYYMFRHTLSLIPVIIDISMFKDENYEGYIYRIGKKLSTHVVECAYRISLWTGHPRLVTTPGADFSVVCSLLYELASGEHDVSLAGAINKFARSPLRKQLDADNQETRRENSDEGIRAREADNFASTRERILNLRKEENLWEELISSKRWNEFELGQLNTRLLHTLEKIRHAYLEYGPHLVWGHQISQSDLQTWWDKRQENDARLLELKIIQGKARRQRNSD